MKSKVVKVSDRLFRYDFDEHMVEWVVKADKGMEQDNKEWMEEYGEPCWEIDESGYVVMDRVGLREENWKNKEARIGYLEGYAFDITEECYWLAENYKRYG